MFASAGPFSLSTSLESATLSADTITTMIDQLLTATKTSLITITSTRSVVTVIRTLSRVSAIEPQVPGNLDDGG